MAARVSGAERRKITLEREAEAQIQHVKMMAERELRTLTREARMMKDKKLTDLAVVKNTKVKNILEEEKEHMEKNLNLMKSTRRLKMDNKKAQDIANLFAKGDDLELSIAEEKKFIEDLEQQIHTSTKQIQAVKKKKGETVVFCSDYQHKKEVERADRSLESWKRKLAAEQKQLALVTKENEDMRVKLQRLIKEKGQFNKLYGQLMAKLTRGKSAMADIVERSRQKFQKRDEVHRKIEALKSKDKADLAKRMEEMQELEMKLFEDKKLACFRYKVQQVRERMEGSHSNSKGSRSSWEHQELMTRLEKTSEFWHKIMEATEKDTFEDVRKYILTEDARIFSMFTFNNEVRDQVEVLTHRTAELITKVTDETEMAEDNWEDSVRRREAMERTLTSLDQKRNDLRDEQDANSRLFDRLLDKVKILFDLVKCSDVSLKGLLGENLKVTEMNYKLYLALVETEVIAILDMASPFLPLDRGVTPSSSRVMKSKLEGLATTTTAFQKKMLGRHCVDCWMMGLVQ